MQLSSTANGHNTAPTLPVSMRDVVRFQIGQESGAPEDEEQPVYLLGHWDLPLKAKYQAALTRRGLRYPQDEEMLDALRAFVESVELAPAETEKILALIEKYRDAKAQKQDLPTDELQELQGIETAADQHSEQVRAIKAARGEFLAVAPYLAAKLMLRGWERLPVVFERKNGEVTAACLAKLPDRDVIMIGFYAASMKEPTERQAKN